MSKGIVKFALKNNDATMKKSGNSGPGVWMMILWIWVMYWSLTQFGDAIKSDDIKALNGLVISGLAVDLLLALLASILVNNDLTNFAKKIDSENEYWKGYVEKRKAEMKKKGEKVPEGDDIGDEELLDTVVKMNYEEKVKRYSRFLSFAKFTKWFTIISLSIMALFDILYFISGTMPLGQLGFWVSLALFSVFLLYVGTDKSDKEEDEV